MAKKQTHHPAAKKFAELLDSRYTIPNTNIRFGIDPVLGLFSGIGDLAGAVLSVYFMFHAVTIGAKPSILLRMFVNILADLLIGSIPILGDAFDIMWKSNLRNTRLLEKLEEDPQKLETESTVLMWILFVFLLIILIGVIVVIFWIFAEVLDALFG